MSKNLMLVMLGILLIGLMGCEIKTPEIRGIVLDAETKQPVKGAWVRATIEVNTKTVAGHVQSSLSIDKPHTRTDENGNFVLPSKSFDKPGFPMGFGTEVVNLAIGASTVDDRGGRINIRKDKLDDFLRKPKLEIVIYSSPVERTEVEYFSHLQSLYSYCLMGRSSVEMPPVEDRCDQWELDYAIAKHERFIKRIGEPKGMDQRIHYVGTIKQLAYLYKQKGDYKKALEIFKFIREYDKKRNMDLWLKEYEHQIKELEESLRKTQK